MKVRTQNSGFKKPDKYISVLGIEEEEKCAFVAWHEIVNMYDETEGEADLEKVFIDDFKELVRYNSPSRRLETVVYDEETGGANIFEVDRSPDMNVVTPVADEYPPFALHVDITRE